MGEPTPTFPNLSVSGLAKTFTLHNQHGAVIPVFGGLALDVYPGECVVLAGRSGVGKSTLMRAIYANYRTSQGQILVRHGDAMVDLATAAPQLVIDVRRKTLGHVGQFLRVIPRVPAIEIVMEPLLANGWTRDAAAKRTRDLLARLNLPESLWSLPPATFSGGEQQRVNVARGFARRYPILLLDEPTASLDPVNRDVVVSLIQEALADGVAIVGIFHDVDVRQRVGTREFTISNFAANAPKEGIAA
ncbi:phosphonate C-P lyase system protein PhnL [Sphingomonas sp. GlSt437]|uniref:phosphonate C-P lyase system protein PhnL n=1 Tax=Sphingomonas sp. GlSt437 TaxID=3389970 RepID=UPI003A897EF2